jgi:pimeloyl-ACP methyl ester carboxylesterase
MGARAALAVLLLLQAGCTDRLGHGPALAEAAGWKWRIVTAGRFDLATASRAGAPGEMLTVFLEGDGLAYVTRSQPAQDPTPTEPLGLRLALAHQGSGPLAWLGRPCQYTLSGHGRGCDQAFWTSRRYAPEVVASLGSALDTLKAASGAQDLLLVGYSGGGALAALLAAERQDVVGLVTVAANLDLAGWTADGGLAPLTGSLDPALAAAPRLGLVPQWHFTGAEDRVTGTGAVLGFMQRLPVGAPAQLIELPGFDHACCWARDWNSLVAPALNALPHRQSAAKMEKSHV